MTALEVTFGPWAQRGLIAVADGTVDADGVPEQATTTVTARLTVDGVTDPAVVPFELRGPADVAALTAGQVVRSDPVDGDEEADPNLFPFVELASPHLPWALTPAATTGQRLMPWIAVVVVEAADAVLRAATGDRLAVLRAPVAQLPDLTEAHAWAHVQTDDGERAVTDVVDTSPQLARARLVCPRHLRAGTAYLAAVVPTFSGGRLSGLGRAVDEATITDPAWGGSGDTSIELPVYHSWSFATAPAPISFEALARRLRPVPAPPSVGSQPLDVSRPGGGLPSGTRPPVTRFRGVLVAPGSSDGPPVATALQDAIRRAVDEPEPSPPSEPFDQLVDDPVVTAPLYGGRAAGETVVPAAGQRPHWLGELNSAPATRVVAALGVEAVRTSQEALMAEAWPQAAGLGTVNRYLVHANAAAAIGRVVERRLVADGTGLADETVLRLSATAHARLAAGPSRTVGGTLADHADIARAAFTTTVGRVGRLGGRSVRTGAVTGAPLVRRIATALLADEATYAPLSISTMPRGTVVLGTALLDRLVVASGGDQTPIATGGAVVVKGLEAVDRPLTAGLAAFSTSLGPVSAARPPSADDWTRLRADARRVAGLAGSITATSSRVLAVASARLDRAGRGAVDALAAAAARLEQAATIVAHHPRPSGPLPPATSRQLQALTTAGARLAGQLEDVLDDVLDPIDWDIPVLVQASRPAGQLTALALSVRASIDPVGAVLAAVQARVQPIPQAGADGLPPPGLSATPTFATPGFEHLRRLGMDYVCPGLDDLGNNIVSLLETNQTAVESFLVGFNTELAKELLWREYPAVLTDTWLTRFWNPPGIGGDDIEPVASWLPGRHLGGAGATNDAVIFVKGDLLVRHPTALVYLLPGVVTPRGKRHVISPDYEQPMAPSFLVPMGRGGRAYGFPVPVDDLRAAPTDLDGGYFVVIEEQAGDPRFGLDDVASEQFDGPPATWDDVGWGHLAADEAALGTLSHARLDAVRVAGLTRGDDTWGDDAAAMARIALRRPFRLIAHARSLLR